MKIKALVSFGGVISMHCGEIREVEDTEVIQDLLNSKYVEEVKARRVKADVSESSND